MNGTTNQCCYRKFDGACQHTAPSCTAGECVTVRGRCPMHCGCAQHGHVQAPAS